jgi:hypothetical protein
MVSNITMLNYLVSTQKNIQVIVEIELYTKNCRLSMEFLKSSVTAALRIKEHKDCKRIETEELMTQCLNTVFAVVVG